MTGVLMVRRTGPPMAVRRGTLMVPDCAVHDLPGRPSRGRARPSGPTSGAGPTAARPSLRAPAPHPSARPAHRSRRPAMGLNCDVAMQSSVAVRGSVLSPPRILTRLPHLHGRPGTRRRAGEGPAGGRRGTSLTAWSPSSPRPSHSAPNVVLELHLPQPQGQRKFLPAGFHPRLPATAERLGRGRQKK
jgi:hypothetical protein